jgi:hypothetical protein
MGNKGNKTLCVKDFTISNDKTELMLIVKHDNGKDIGLHLNIKKQYYNSIEYTGYKYGFIYDNFNNNEMIEEDNSRIEPIDGYSFDKFYNYENCIGIIYKKQNTNKLSIYMPFWDKFKLYSKEAENTTLKIEDINLIDIKNGANALIDVVDNKKMLTIAYITNNTYLSNLKNRFDVNIDYDTDKKVDLTYFNNAIITKEYKFNNT